MPSGPVFPAFIRLEHQRDGSAKASFLAEVASITGDAEKRFKQSFDEIGRTIDRSLSSLKAGSSNLSLDVPGLRKVAADAEFASQRLAAMRDAAVSLAAKTGDTSAATTSYLAALRAQVTEAERARDTANAQVTTYSRLQSEIDKTVAANQRLAQSYRDTFLEEAKAANYATTFQNAINAKAAPGLNRGYSRSARDSASVFEDQAYKPKADLRGGVDKLLAGSASIDRAALSATTLEQVLGRVSTKGQQVAAALSAAADEAARASEAEAQRVAKAKAEEEAAFARAAQTAKEYAASANQLRGQLDPALAAQQRFDAELARADDLLRAGAITTKEYAQAQALARENLQASWTALTASQEANTRAARQGTNAQQMVVNSFRSQRYAFIQANQQLQDMAIQFQMGTNASTIFAQQVPQLGFALSGISKEATGLTGALGAFGRFMTGGWGTAIAIGVVALSPLINSLFETGDEAEKAKGKTFDFSKGLDVLKLSADETTTAMQQLVTEMRNAIQVQGDFLKQKAGVAKQSVTDIQGRISQNQAELDRISKPGLTDLIPFRTGQDIARAKALTDQLAVDRAALKDAQQAATSAELAVSQSRVIESLDGRAAATKRYERAVGELNKAYDAQRNNPDPLAPRMSQAEYEKRFRKLTETRDAAIKAVDDAKRAARGTGSANREFGREIDLSTAKSIAQSAGFQVNSDHRSYAEQKKLYDDWVAAGKPSNNPAARPGTSAHERDNALDIQIKAGVTAASIKKAYADEGVRLTKIFKERGHFHIEWSTSGADKVDREAEQLADYGKRAAESIQQINERFNEQPRLIDSANAATRKLDETIAELQSKQPPGFQQMITDAKVAKDVIQDALVRPFRDMERDAQRRVQVQSLELSGLYAQANAVQDIWRLEKELGPLSDERKAQIYAQAEAEERVNEVLKARSEIQNDYLDAMRSIRGELENLFSGESVNFGRIFRQLQGKLLVQNLFGDVFTDMEKYIRHATGVDDAVDLLKTSTTHASDVMNQFADAALSVTSRLSGGSAFSGSFGSGSGSGGSLLGSLGIAAIDRELAAVRASGPANDNSYVDGADIVVTATRAAQQGFKTSGTVLALTPEVFFSRMFTGLGNAMGTRLSEALGGSDFAKKLGGVVGGAVAGGAIGGLPGSVLGGLKEIPGLSKGIDKLFGGTEILGKALSGAGTGTLVSGISNALGIKMNSTGAQIGGAIGSLIPIPGASIVTSVIGGLLGNLFHKVQSGYAQVRGGVVAGTYGRTGSMQNDAAALAGDLITEFKDIANQLGATLGKFDFDIGKKDNSYGFTPGSGPSAGITQWFGTQEQAVTAALRFVIGSGAVQGISDAVKRLVSSGDIQTQLEKAVKFQNVFTDLRAILDPVGAAIEAINKKFADLTGIFVEAGASADDYAKLQQLYDLQRAQAVKQTTDQIVGSLKSLLTDLGVNNSAYSLQDRFAMATTAYNPLKARVAANDTTAFGDYADASRTYADVARQLYGSQSGYFSVLNDITGTANSAIAMQQAISSNDNVVGAIDSQTATLSAQLEQLNGNVVALAKTLTAQSPAAPDTPTGYYDGLRWVGTF